ncbi:MAG: methyltransferase domain-containing protein [Cytophagales bacterium]|nr:methyltransferase domain-containing protein [Armatimonadota bacterium]
MTTTAVTAATAIPPRLSEETARFLVSPEGGRLLNEVAALPGDTPQRVLALRKRGLGDPAILTAALAVADARHRARLRFPDAHHLFFTSEALAQATSPMIARYHAGQLAASGARTVVDLGCGIGMDSLALAEAGLTVLALERDPARVIFARANAAARGVTARITFRAGDVTALDWEADAAYWDPSRRVSAEGRRVSRWGDQYEPPLSFLAQIESRVRLGGCVKLSPALPDEALAELGGRTEFLSEGRECKEACVWFGALEGVSGAAATAAVLLRPEGPLVLVPRGDPGDPSPGVLGRFLFDPDPAVIRSGALGTLAERLSAHRIGAADAYLTGDDLPTGELRAAAAAYRVLDSQPYRPKQVKEMLRARGFGRLVIKKRHFSKEPDVVARELQLPGGGAEGTLVLVRTASSPRAEFWSVLCEPV